MKRIILTAAIAASLAVPSILTVAHAGTRTPTDDLTERIDAMCKNLENQGISMSQRACPNLPM